MATAVESLDQLERRLTISFPLREVQSEVEKRLKARARTTKAPGFRPGKVPLKMVAAQFGYQIESEVLNDRISSAFAQATNDNNLHVVGTPKIEAKEGGVDSDGLIAFSATFEVYPEVALGELAALEIEKVKAEVSDAEIDKTIDILRKQRVHYHTKGEHSEHGDGGDNPAAQKGDRVTIDFVGTVDGVEFEGGKSENFPFVLGEGHMLPEFETAVVGLTVGQSTTFPLSFPADYHGQDVAGKTAEFTISLTKLEWAHLPAIDADFARSLGIVDGDLQQMREDVKQNLGREVSARVKARNKDMVMAALVGSAKMDVPKTLINQELERLGAVARENMTQRGMDMKGVTLPPELFAAEADRRVRLGLILTQMVFVNQLQAKPEQVKAQIEEFAQSYEDPREVLKYYFSDRNRLAEIEALVIEENVVNYVLDQAKVTEKLVPFDELMGNNGQA